MPMLIIFKFSGRTPHVENNTFNDFEVVLIYSCLFSDLSFDLFVFFLLLPSRLSPLRGVYVRVRVIRERLSATPGHVIGQGPAPGGGVVPCGGGGSGGGVE